MIENYLASSDKEKPSLEKSPREKPSGEKLSNFSCRENPSVSFAACGGKSTNGHYCFILVNLFFLHFSKYVMNITFIQVALWKIRFVKFSANSYVKVVTSIVCPFYKVLYHFF